MEYPAKNLVDALNACNPTRPLDAGDPRYVDLASGRGDEGSAIARCRKRILGSETPLVQLLAGHRGCGKSTELRGLQRSLEDEGYFVVRFEVDGDVDLEDTEPTDILLAMIRNLESRLREANLVVDPKLLDDFLLWFGEVVLEKTERSAIEAELSSEISIGGEIPLFAKLLARFSGQLKTGTESKRNVRRKLDPRITELLERGRLLAVAAREKVRKAGRKDLVMIVDNLDRIALKEREGGRTTHEVLFVERGELFGGLNCHVVLTLPISLVFSPKQATLGAIFSDLHVLPMVKIAEKGTRKPWHPGRRLLDDLLRQRLDLDTLFENGTTDQLIKASGGHPRELMRLVQDAVLFVDEPPVTRLAVRKAFRRLVNGYDRSIPEEHWPKLARVYRDQKVKNDEAHQLMLFNLSVLEYQNEARWCDVHPAILELPQFKAELERLNDEPGD
jgi:hypothetical protein